jgi:hypothetical protein
MAKAEAERQALNNIVTGDVQVNGYGQPVNGLGHNAGVAGGPSHTNGNGIGMNGVHEQGGYREVTMGGT